MYNNNTSILPLMVFCLKMDMIAIPHTNSNLYSVPKFIVFKSQKDLLTRTEVVAREQLCLLYRRTTAKISPCNKIPPQIVFCHIKIWSNHTRSNTVVLFCECSKWVLRYLLNAKRAIFLAISWREQGTFRWLNDDICFVLDQQITWTFSYSLLMHA